VPKLNTFQILARLEGYIKRMEAEEDVALRDIKAILGWVGDEYVAWIDEEKERQRELKKTRRARTEQEKVEFGYKTIQQILLDAMLRARNKLEESLLEELDKEQKRAEIRQANIYLSAFSKARKEGKSLESAKAWANNELTRAGLRRVDGQQVGPRSRRDREVWEIEDALEEQFYNEATKEEQEQYDMLYESNGEIPRWREQKAKKNAKK